MKNKLFVSIMLTLILIVTNSRAYELSGTVFGIDGKPVSDVQISLYNDFHDQIERCYSNYKGEYIMKNLEAGTYTLEAVKTKFPKYSTTVQISGPTGAILYQDVYFTDIMVHPGVTRSDMTQLYLPSNYPLRSSVLSDYRRSLALIDSGKMKKAKKVLKNITRSDPSFSRAYLQLGILAAQDHRQEALDLFTKAHELNPSDPYPLLHTAELEIAMTNYKLAGELVGKALELDPSINELFILKGKIEYFEGRLTDSELNFMRAMSSKLPPSGEADVRRFLGEICLAKGRFEEARTHFSLFLKNMPDAPEASEIREKIRSIETVILEQEKKESP